jgi:uncharacterized protein YajQ (UPF0234 family)
MPSFDMVSEVDMHEVSNAVDQASREVATRFDFKGTDSRFEREEAVITVVSESDFQVEQMLDILRAKLNRRGIDLGVLALDPPETSGKLVRRKVTIRQGLDSETCRKAVKDIKAAKLKVQAAIQGDRVRVTGKKRDDLQRVIAAMREIDLGIPVQFTNFRD